MPSYTDPYVTVRRHERELRAATGRYFQFKYEGVGNRQVVCAVYYRPADESAYRRLTAFPTLEEAVAHAYALCGLGVRKTNVEWVAGKDSRWYS